MRQFEVFVDNKIGKLAEVCETISKAGVNIRAIATEVKDNTGIIKFVAEDENLARFALNKAKMNFKEFEIVPARLRDKPGEMAKVCRALANLGINIESVFVLSHDRGTTEIAFKVNDLKKAREILG